MFVPTEMKVKTMTPCPRIGCALALFSWIQLGAIDMSHAQTQEVPAAASPPRTLSLQEALRLSREHQPQLLQARAQTAAARARVESARAPLLPQVTGTAAYQRSTANFVARPGAVPSQFTSTQNATSLDTFNYFNFGLTLSQYIWDFGQTTRKWQAARATAEAQGATEQVAAQQVGMAVQAAYFAARAQKALMQVARDNLANQDRHLTQVQAFVQVGTRPEIDLAQARTDRANAAVQVITAENGYSIAKAQLNQAMGVEDAGDYDVADDTLPAVAGEDGSGDALLAEAQRGRPEFTVLARQIAAQQLTLSATKGAYGPSLNAAMSLTDAGTDITQLAWNWSASINLNWPLFQGLLTMAQVKEQRANLSALEAQQAGLRQQVRVEIEQARLQVRAGKATTQAAAEALANARERLRLAEARYRTGVGSIIELGDAQLAMTTAAAQAVQADYTLASARASLRRALGHIE